MNIPLLGVLEHDPESSEWVSEPRLVPFFDDLSLPFVLESLEQADEEEVNEAVAAFLNLTFSDRLAAAQYVFANYLKMAKLAGEDLDCHIESEGMVREHVDPCEVVVSRRESGDCAIYVAITGNCDWDQEHGLQIVYRRGRELARVSDQDGHLTNADAYDLAEDEDSIVR